MGSASNDRSVLNWVSLTTFAMALMLSSDSLMILGNATGMAGISFLFTIAIAVLIHFATVFSYGEVFSVFTGPGAEVNYVGAALGRLPVMVFPLLSRLMYPVCAATGFLATAGYVFNEVFLYWFPNLGFSFCLLGSDFRRRWARC